MEEAFPKYLQSQLEYYKSIISSLYGLMIIDKDYNVVYVNTPFLKRMKYSTPDDVIGKKCYTVSHGFTTPCENTHMCPHKNVMATRKEFEAVHTHTDNQGNTRWIKILSSPIINDKGELENIIESQIDITDFVETQQKLKVSEEKLRKLIETTHDLYWCIRIKDIACLPTWEITAMNRRWAGKTQSEFNNKVENMCQYHTQSSWDIFIKACGDTIKENKVVSNILLTAIDPENGQVIEYWDNEFFPLYDGNEVIGVQCLSRDITQNMVFIKQLQEKNYEMEQVLHIVSHDLKSPLVAITGYTNILRDLITTGNVKDIYKVIDRLENSNRKMQRLISELLELSKIGKTISDTLNASFSEICEEALNALEIQIKRSKVSVNISPNLPYVFVDKNRVIQVLSNLIANSIKFMGSQPNPRIDIGSFLEEGRVVFYVRDNGIGFNNIFKDKVFELFSKLNPTTEGTGIGLAIVKKIIEVHNGQIWVDSELGKGTTFYFTLPVKK